MACFWDSFIFSFAKLEVVVGVTMEIIILWDVMLYSLVAILKAETAISSVTFVVIYLTTLCNNSNSN
jgi:hypothetical protein